MCFLGEVHSGGSYAPTGLRALCIGGMREGKGRVWRERWDWRKPDDARGPLGAAASRGCGSRIVKL